MSVKSPASQPEKPNMRHGSWVRVCGRLCLRGVTTYGSVGGPGVTIDLMDWLGNWTVI